MYAVITGASSGFGLEFARQFAKRKYNLCIAARREEPLAALKTELESRYGITVDVLPVDLSDENGPRTLYDFTKTKKPDVLVNNAGIALAGMPEDADLSAEMKMLDINVRALHALTRLYLTDMMAGNSGRILNIASQSALLPVPFLSAYAAGKAYVLHLSEGINFELVKSGSRVRVSVVTPGFFNTGIAAGSIQMAEQHRSIPAYIGKVVDQFLRGKEIIVIGKDRQIFILNRFVLRSMAKKILYAILRKTFRKK